MMSMIRRFLGLDNIIDLELNERAERAERELARKRMEYQQTIQRMARGVRLMDSWSEANRMIIGEHRGKHSS